jgi:hypothetical protein
MALSMRSEAIVLEYWPVYLLISVGSCRATAAKKHGLKIESTKTEAGDPNR